ncbi:MAG: hypothetical protein OEM05_04905 [Myxococcales bacterium]|nr:hypothetical protein [Myxococcales bacterium]
MARSQAFCLVVVTCTALAGAVSCAGGLPAVVSSTPAEIAVEYERGGNLKAASKLATSGCQRYGLLAEFDSVAPAVSEKSNVVKYRCVQGSVAAERD